MGQSDVADAVGGVVVVGGEDGEVGSLLAVLVSVGGEPQRALGSLQPPVTHSGEY